MLGHTIHRGVGVSRKTGILHARGDVIVMLDADGTYSADDIPRLLRFIPEYDQVIGVRSKEYGKLKFVRKAVKSVLFSLASFLSQHKILDLNSGLRVFKKDIMMRYLHLIPDGFSCVSTMTLVFLYHNHSIKFTPIAYHSRIGKSKFNIVRDTLGMTLVILCLTIKFRKSARLAR
jgi:glycosyltransferase involved in cell wall biosynthesis